MLLHIYGIQTAIKYRFSADNHAPTCVRVQINGFSSVYLINFAVFIVGAFYFWHWESPRASYVYYAAIASVSHYIIAVSCTCTLLGAIF